MDLYDLLVIKITSIVEKTERNTVNNVIIITIKLLTQPSFLFKCYSIIKRISNRAIITIPTNKVIHVVISLKKNLFNVCIPICSQKISSYRNPLCKCKPFFSSIVDYCIVNSYYSSFSGNLKRSIILYFIFAFNAEG